MGLPNVVLTESGSTSWQEILESSGYKVELDQEEIDRCTKSGSFFCEKVDHPRLVSEYPFLISRDNTFLRCLEVKQHDNSAGLVFFPKERIESQLLDQVREILITSGAVDEKAKHLG